MLEAIGWNEGDLFWVLFIVVVLALQGLILVAYMMIQFEKSRVESKRWMIEAQRAKSRHEYDRLAAENAAQHEQLKALVGGVSVLAESLRVSMVEDRQSLDPDRVRALFDEFDRTIAEVSRYANQASPMHLTAA